MGAMDDLGHKVKGNFDQAKGNVNKERGKGAKGGMQNIKGKMEEAAADFKPGKDKDRSEKDKS
jgi:hypothetical protein